MRARVAGLLLASAAAVIPGGGCGGGTTTPPGPGSATDASADSSDGAVLSSFDQTTGQPCSSDAMCWGANGPGTNRCTIDADYVRTVAGVAVQLWPSPICLPPLPPAVGTAGNCDPAPPSDPLGAIPHFCDGPDVPTSPGVCVPFSLNSPQSGQGICYPKCTFATSGGQSVGCAGNDTCVFYNFVLFGSSITGVGFCQGSCQQDADCVALGAGYVCQSDLGFCTKSPVVRTLGMGESCASADANAGACNCYFNAVTDSGYCTTACVVGGTTCPSGWVCDPAEPAVVSFVGVATTYPVGGATTGMVGTCVPACASTDGGGPSAEAGALDGAANGDATSDDASTVGGDAAPTDEGGGEASSADGAIDVETPGPDGAPDAEAGLMSGAGGGCPASSSCVTGGVVGPDCQP